MAKGIRLLVLDVLKPHQPMVTELALGLSELKGVDGVNITLVEIDKETENVKITIVGDNLNYEEIVRTIEEFGELYTVLIWWPLVKRLLKKVKLLKID